MSTNKTALEAFEAERQNHEQSQLEPGDRIVSLHARRPGKVVKVYPDGSACVLWDKGEPEGMGYDRMPRDLLELVSRVASIEKRKVYGQTLCKTLLRYTNDAETDEVVADLEALVQSISARRHVPGLVAARYDVFRKFWLQECAL